MADVIPPGWYDSLKLRVQGQEISCCSDADCFPTPAVFIDGVWWATPRRGKPGEKVKVPEDRIVPNKVSPYTHEGEGLAVLCQGAYSYTYTAELIGDMGTPFWIFCFVIPPTFF
jgi:hypothetical protein